MENRISELFKRKKNNILSVFYTAGFPNAEDTVFIAQHLEQAGADLIEIGIPFSDPVADGPVIQESNKVAIGNGMTLKKLLIQVGEIRKEAKIPIILMGYLNPIFQYGFDVFCKEASEAGVDGLIIPDLPLDEYQSEYKKSMDACGLKMTFLISPTTSEERILKIDNLTNGFIYAVSASSTTGAKEGFSEEQKAYFKRLHSYKLRNPFLIGFGISNRLAFQAACEYGAGAILGTAFIMMMKESLSPKDDIEKFVREIGGVKLS